jgi:hypothetical protein
LKIKVILLCHPHPDLLPSREKGYYKLAFFQRRDGIAKIILSPLTG